MISQWSAHDIVVRPVLPLHGVIRVPQGRTSQPKVIVEQIPDESEDVHGIEVVVVHRGLDPWGGKGDTKINCTVTSQRLINMFGDITIGPLS